MNSRFIRILGLPVCLVALFLAGCGGDDSEDTGNSDPNAPVFNSIADQTVTPGDTLQFTVLAIDPNGEGITYSSTAVGTPDIYSQTSASFNGATFFWATSNTDDGVYTVRFTATNTSQLSDTETVEISVVGLVTQGKSLYDSNCSRCHGTETSTGSTFAVWQSTSAAIQEAINLNQGGMGSISLNSSELDAIEAYLATVNP